MPPAVPGEKHDFPPLKLPGQQIVRGRAKGRLDLHPFLPGQTFDVIQSAAADNANAIVRHGGRYNGEPQRPRAKFGRERPFALLDHQVITRRHGLSPPAGEGDWIGPPAGA